MFRAWWLLFSTLAGVLKVLKWRVRTTFSRQISSTDAGRGPRSLMFSAQVKEMFTFGSSNVFTFIFSDYKEVTGCDLGLLFHNNETADVEFEKLGQGGNRFKFWCKNATQRLVQKEAPYHKVSCALDFLHWGMRWKSVRILDLKPWKNLLDRK